jgi:hypothetical protein
MDCVKRELPKAGGQSSPESSISEDRCQNICHFRENSLRRKSCGKRQELPKAEVSEFILTVDSGGRVQRSDTLEGFHSRGLRW